MTDVILVLGGTGFLGEAVARRLQADGYSVRIMARNMGKARRLFDEKAFSLVSGDAADPGAVSNALDGCSGVHISLDGPIERIAVPLIADLAARQGLSRISYISGSTVCEENAWFPYTRDKLNSERAVMQCGVPYAIFCPTWFFEMLTRFVRGNRAFLIGKLTTPYHFLSIRDLARMVSGSYRLDAAANKRFYIHGPETITVRAALERYLAALHPEITTITAMPFWLNRLMATLTRNEQLKFATELMAYFEKVGEPGDPTEANTILGAPTITCDAWLTAQQESDSPPVGMSPTGVHS